ncbi:MAG TPA: PepSY domain-containing protein [Methylophilaceae bacterium]|nr:PepSY domain-containing protein [Methylophilaceae bacterium]
MGNFSWFKWHRRIGVVTCFGILLWGVSGMSHPIMSHLQPKPVSFMPPHSTMHLEDSVFPNDVLAMHKIKAFQRLGVIALNNALYFRVAESASTPARYFASSDAQELPDGDRRYAEMLASHYTGLPQTSITSAKYITAFSDDYHAVNQLLPVWRIEYAGDQHLRAFIDTDQARLSALVDDTRLTLTKMFRFGHNWSFLEDFPRLQLCLMALVLTTALVSTCSGLYLYVSRRHHAKSRFAHQPAKRWHRRLGLVVAVSTLMFACSGLLHLIVSYQQATNKIVAIYPSIATSQLSPETWHLVMHSPVHKLDLTSFKGQPYWLIQNEGPRAQVAALAQEEHHHGDQGDAKVKLAGPLLVNASTLDATPADIMTLAAEQAATYANLAASDVVKISLVSLFGGEYGFLFKRLPVVRAQFKGEGNPRYFIEPATGALSAKVTDGDALEGWIFAYIHKWNFADANKYFRDILVSLFALGNIMVALMGLYLFSRRQA